MASFHIVRSEWRSYVYKTLSHLASSEKIVSLKFSKNSFDISEKEFIHNGHYYDVVKHEIEGDSINVYCFDDETETQLVAEYHDLLFENTAQKSDFQGKANGFFQLLIKEYLFETPFSLPYPPSVCEAISAVFYYKNTFFISPFLDFDSPPPQEILIYT